MGEGVVGTEGGTAFHVCTIAAVEDVTPQVRRLAFRGAAISAFETPRGALAPYLKIRLPTENGGCCLRTYSIRRLDLRRREMHVDIVRHPGASVGSHFAETVKVGDAVELAGPGFIPADPCRRYLLAGDHTALPAAGQMLDALGPEANVHVVLEVPNASERQPLARSPTVEVTWLHRPAGEASRLAHVVASLCGPDEPDLFVWAGAEAAIARAIRRHVRACGIPAARRQILNYWKSGRPEGFFSYVA